MLRSLLVVVNILFPIASVAQQGWVRIADGPWRKPDALCFLSSDTGYVLEHTPSGETLYFTFNGGRDWVTDTALHVTITPCIRKTDLVRGRIPLNYYLTHQKLVSVGWMYYTGCDIQTYRGGIWTLDLSTRKWNEIEMYYPLDTLEVVSPVMLLASCYKGNYEGKSQMVYSADSGKTWSEAYLGTGRDYVRIIPRFINRDTGYVWSEYIGGKEGQEIDFHWTEDGGKTWRVVNRPMMDSSGLSFSGPFYGNNGLWYDNSEKGLRSSTNLGRTWQPATQPPILFRQKPDDAFFSFDEGYRPISIDSISSIIQFTFDSTKTWLALDTVEGVLKEISAPTDRVAYAVGDDGLLYKTTDGGGRFPASVSISHSTEYTLSARWANSAIAVTGVIAGKALCVYDILGRQRAHLLPEASSATVEVAAHSSEVLIVVQEDKTTRVIVD